MSDRLHPSSYSTPLSYPSSPSQSGWPSIAIIPPPPHCYPPPPILPLPPPHCYPPPPILPLPPHHCYTLNTEMSLCPTKLLIRSFLFRLQPLVTNELQQFGRRKKPLACSISGSAMLYCAVLCHAMLCCTMLYYAMLCYAMLCCTMLYYAILCYAMPCYAMLCCTMLCYAMLCCAKH